MILGLFHVAIRTADLDATRRFYTSMLGMIEAERPALPFPGIWLRAPGPAAVAIIHVYAGIAAEGGEGVVPVGGAAVDHVSLAASGFDALRERLRVAGLDWREQCTPGRPLQLFTFDPSGILLELTVDVAGEGRMPVPTPGKAFQAGHRDWFRPEAYRQFSAAAGRNT